MGSGGCCNAGKNGSRGGGDGLGDGSSEKGWGDAS